MQNSKCLFQLQDFWCKFFMVEAATDDCINFTHFFVLIQIIFFWAFHLKQDLPLLPLKVCLLWFEFSPSDIVDISIFPGKYYVLCRIPSGSARWYAKKAWRLLYSDLSKSILTGSPYLVRISHPPVPSLACEEEVSTCPFRSRRNRCVMTRKQLLFGQTREQILNNLHEV